MTEQPPIVLQVPMDYPGKVVSVNHCYAHANGRKYLRREAKVWRTRLAESLGYLLIGEGLRDVPLSRDVRVRIDCAYINEHEATDPDNLRKLTHDAIEEATGINDRHYQPERGAVTYGAPIPSITVTVFVRPR